MRGSLTKSTSPSRQLWNPAVRSVRSNQMLSKNDGELGFVIGLLLKSTWCACFGGFSDRSGNTLCQSGTRASG